jgi:hypothetical protein
MSFKTYREESKINYGSVKEKSTLEEINTGSLQRIADATEKMASNYQKMENDLAMYKRWYEERGKTVDKLNYTIRTLKGVITKLKKRKA